MWASFQRTQTSITLWHKCAQSVLLGSHLAATDAEGPYYTGWMSGVLWNLGQTHVKSSLWFLGHIWLIPHLALLQPTLFCSLILIVLKPFLLIPTIGLICTVCAKVFYIVMINSIMLNLWARLQCSFMLYASDYRLPATNVNTRCLFADLYYYFFGSKNQCILISNTADK